MMKDKKKQIDAFIKKGLELEKTSLDFSDKVMQQINASALEKDKAMSSLLQKYTLEEPSKDFTSGVLQQIEEATKATTYQPVISKKVWYVLFFAMVLVLVYDFTYTDDLGSPSGYLGAILQKLENLFSFKTPGLLQSPIFALSMFTLSALLFLDYFLNNRKPLV